MNENIRRTDDIRRMNQMIASVLRNIRKRKGMTQAALSETSGVSVGSIKRFEKTGNISLTSFSKLVVALGLENELTGMFEDVKCHMH